jgi:hypothetical protein
MTSNVRRASAVTAAAENGVQKARHYLEAPRRINSLGVYVDRFTVVTNLHSAAASLTAAAKVVESCREWPTSLDYDEV